MAWQCAAAFRSGLAGICGSVITRASTRGREEGTCAREVEVHGAVLATVNHDGGDDPVSSERKQASNVPLPPRNRLWQEVEEVEGS
jgi:hypothetical protein